MQNLFKILFERSISPKVSSCQLAGTNSIAEDTAGEFHVLYPAVVLTSTRNCAVARPTPELVPAALTKELMVKLLASSADTT